MSLLMSVWPLGSRGSYVNEAPFFSGFYPGLVQL